MFITIIKKDRRALSTIIIKMLSSQDVRDEFEVLTALIYYYKQRTRKPGESA